MNAQQLADQIRNALGPDWWAAHVAVAIQQAQAGLLISLIILAIVIAAGVFGAIVLARSDGDLFDKGMGLMFGGVIWLMVTGIVAGIAISSQSTITSPDLHVWDDLVRDISAVLR